MKRKHTVTDLLDKFFNNIETEDKDIVISTPFDSEYCRLEIDGRVVLKRYIYDGSSKACSVYCYIDKIKDRKYKAIMEAVFAMHSYKVKRSIQDKYYSKFVISDDYNSDERVISDGGTMTLEAGMLNVPNWSVLPLLHGEFKDNYHASQEVKQWIEANYGESEILTKLYFKQTAQPLLTKNINFLGVSEQEPKMLSYLDESKWFRGLEQGVGLRIPANLYTNQAITRYHGKPAKVLRKLFNNPDMFSQQEYEKVVRLWNKKFAPLEGCSLERVEPFQIPALYSVMNHAPNMRGSLGGSCMRDKSANYFEIYNDNCEGMLVMFDGDKKVMGRALLWKLDDGMDLMDRVYHSSEDVEQAFFQWAKDNNFTRKTYQSYNNKSEITSPTGEEDYKDLVKTLKFDKEYERYPYLDTLSYGDDNMLSSAKDDNERYYDSLSGSYSDITPAMRCEECSDRINNEDELYCQEDGNHYCDSCASYSEQEDDNVPHSVNQYSEYHNEYLFDEHTRYSSDRRVYFHYECEDFIYVERNDDYIHTDDTVYCEHIEEDVREDDAIYSNLREEHILMNDAVAVTDSDGNSDWILKDDAVFSKALDTHIVKDDAIETEDGEYVYEINEDEETND